VNSRPDVRRQELWCHNCDHHVQFNLDLSLDGNHTLTCPNCGHEHCRVVEAGRITGIRWDSRKAADWGATGVTSTSNSVTLVAYATASSSYTGDLWLTMVGGTTA